MDDAQINLKDYTLLKKIGAGVSGEAFCMNLSSGLFEHIHIYNIKMIKICEYAFFNCCRLRKVEIPTNSNLQTIEKYAFSYSKIEEISIPASVTKICENAFSKFIKYYIFIQKFSFKSFFYFKNRAF